jgi:integrase
MVSLTPARTHPSRADEHTNCGFKEPKSKRSRRTIPLPPFAVERVRRYRVEQAQRFMAAGVRPDGDTLVFGCTTGGTVTLRCSCKAVLKTVSTALEHSSVAITVDTYAHISPAMLQSVAQRFGNVTEKHA